MFEWILENMRTKSDPGYSDFLEVLRERVSVYVQGDIAIIIKEAKKEYEQRCEEAVRLNKPKPKPSNMSYFSKAHKLRAATVVPKLLEFAEKYGLKLTDNELKGGEHFHGPGEGRPVYPELAGMNDNWLKFPKDSLYISRLENSLI